MTATLRLSIRWPLLLAALALSAPPAAAQLPAPPASARELLRVGGYGSLVFGHSSLGSAAVMDDLTGAAAALLASGSVGGRLSYFGEIEAASRTNENWTGRQSDQAPQIDRLYAEYAFADALRLRAGRFLTPVGQWNEIHADPLTWTSLRPLTTYRPFAKSTTGIMAAGQLPIGGHDAGYALYYAPVRVGPTREETGFVSAAGGRVAVELLPGLYLGASAAAYRATRPRDPEDQAGAPSDALLPVAARAGVAQAGDDPTPGSEQADTTGDREEDVRARRLLGADLSWSAGRVEVLAEATALSAGSVESAERGAFAQAAVRVAGPLRAVARFEAYDPVVTGPLRILTLGGAVRLPHLTLKLDRQIPDRASARVANGWFVSASAIF